MGDPIEIRGFVESDLDAIVEFSLRAWEPIYESFRRVLGDPIFFRLHPDWRIVQADAVRACASDAGMSHERGWPLRRNPR
jgi:hypothetical protein